MLRLQKDLLESSDWLWQFLASHETYRAFLPELMELTTQQRVKHFPVPPRIVNALDGSDLPEAVNDSRIKTTNGTTLMGGGKLVSSSMSELTEAMDMLMENNVGIGSEYARELGFLEVAPVIMGSHKKSKKKKVYLISNTCYYIFTYERVCAMH